MPEISVNIEVFCAKCGEGLCNQTEFTTTRYRGEPSFRVMPCERCLAEAHDDGYNEGHDKGFEQAREQYESE